MIDKTKMGPEPIIRQSGMDLLGGCGGVHTPLLVESKPFKTILRIYIFPNKNRFS